jgi:hypothetical protein
MPTATIQPSPCTIDRIREDYRAGQWSQCEHRVEECLRVNPLETAARLVLVRIYLMRGYAAKEPRWLDEAKRQLKMAEGDPAYDVEAKELLLLIEQPSVE